MDWVVWVTWGLLWCFYQLFGLSFWRHPFTAEHPLVNIEISSNLFGWESNSSASDGLRVRKCSVKSHFWGTIPLLVMAKMGCESDVSSEKSSNLICLQTALFCYLMQWHSHIEVSRYTIMCLNKLLLLAHICTADSVYELENTWQYFVCISVSKYMLKSVEEYHTVYSADQILQQARMQTDAITKSDPLCIYNNMTCGW